MRESLKPKDMQIEGLKDQLSKLEEVLEKEMQKLKTLGEVINKQESKQNQYQADLKRQ